MFLTSIVNLLKTNHYFTEIQHILVVYNIETKTTQTFELLIDR